MENQENCQDSRYLNLWFQSRVNKHYRVSQSFQFLPSKRRVHPPKM